jgi:hypothetical protein
MKISCDIYIIIQSNQKYASTNSSIKGSTCIDLCIIKNDRPCALQSFRHWLPFSFKTLNVLWWQEYTSA